jgi:hypothetical protein
MNKYVKTFFLRGLIFSGLGPVVMGIIYLILSYSLDDFTATGPQIFLAIISTYVIAFVQAGASVFNQIEHWSVPKSVFFHFSSIYIVYIGAYLINFWIPFEWLVIAIFTAIFVVSYFVIWLCVYISIKLVEKKLNKALR